MDACAHTPDCELCNDTGLGAKRNRYPCAYVCPGPVPDDARGVFEAFCDCEVGESARRRDRRRVAADELSSIGLSIAERVTSKRALGKE
jgi:hypothetical protein